MTYTDQYYTGADGTLYFLSAQDHADAERQTLGLPQADWTPITSAQVASILSPALTVSSAQAEQVTKLKAACQNALLSGFTSTVLSTNNFYPSQDSDQRNLQSAVSASQGQDSSWSTLLWCQLNGTWSLEPHTAAEVQLVNTAWVAFRTQTQQKYASLLAEVNATDIIEVVQATNW